MAAKRLRKQYEKPKKIWDKARIEVEGKLGDEYGLKNSRELWKMQTLLRKLRREARRLLSGKGKNLDERKQKFIGKVKGFLIRKQDVSLDDILSLSVRDILERRLQSLAYKKHYAKTIRQARQFIAHGHIAVKGRRVSSPSYLVKFEEEETVGWYGHAIPLEARVPQKAAEPAPAAGITDASEITAKRENVNAGQGGEAAAAQQKKDEK